VGTKTKTTPKTTVDWSLSPRGIPSATAQAAMGLVALGGAGDLAHLSPVWAGLGAGVGALSHLVVSAHQAKHTPGAIVYRLVCWAGGGTWLTWAMSGPHNWWNVNGLAALAVGAVGAGIAAPIANQTRRKADAAARRRGAGGDLVPATGPLGAEWEARFYRVSKIKVKVVAINKWPNGAGYDVVGQLPLGPATRDRIAAVCDGLATDARLPDGCGCELKPPRPGGHRGEFTLGVSTANRLGTRGDGRPPKLTYPADYSPRSILQQIDLGEHRDSSLAGVQLREDSMLVTGRKGGGKTNLLDVTTLGIGRCKDALPWHIDLNGGGMSQFWLHPWLQGETDRPPIDWAASTPIEALFMVKLALAIAKDRKSSYRTFKAQANAKLLPVSEHLPEIVIMIDEGAEALKPTNNDPITRQVRDGLEEIQRIGRNEGVNVVISSLRPTAGSISTDILNQSAIRLGMYGLSAADLGHLYDWQRGISMDDLPVKGTTFITTMPDAPRPMKAYFLEPEQIKQAAVAIAAYRPELDDASAGIANAEYEFNIGGRTQLLADLYATRYDRMRAAFTGQSAELPVIDHVGSASPSARPVGRTTAAGPTPLRVIHGGGMGAGTSAANWPDPFDRRPSQPQPVTVARAADWPDPLPSRRLAGTTAAGQLTAPPAPVRPVPELVRRALAAFDSARDDRMHSETLAAALDITPHDLAELLRPVEVRSLRNAFVRGGGDPKRGYAREDFAQAADRIARGELGVPPELDAWHVT
jgi:hypothetical protein